MKAIEDDLFDDDQEEEELYAEELRRVQDGSAQSSDDPKFQVLSDDRPKFVKADDDDRPKFSNVKMIDDETEDYEEF